MNTMISKYREFAPDANSAPFNMKEITSDEWWRWYGFNHHIAEWGSIWLLRNTPSDLMHEHLQILFEPRSKEGIGFIRRVERAQEVTPQRYFKFAVCEHVLVHHSLGNCLHTYKCDKCDYSFTVDSSG